MTCHPYAPNIWTFLAIKVDTYECFPLARMMAHGQMWGYCLLYLFASLFGFVGTAQFGSPRPNVMFPLNQGCSGTASFAANFGSNTLSSSAVTTVGVGTMHSLYQTMTNMSWFPTGSYAFPPVSCITIQDASPNQALNVFGGSFTVSLLFMAASPPGDDMPIIELLGPSAGHICISVRLGCNGECVQFYWKSTCDCANNGVINMGAYTKVLSWTHYALTYDSNTHAMVSYLNGTMSARITQSLGSLATTL
jgi:hypothetical protein